MTRITPTGVRLIYRLKPGLSVSSRDTSARQDSAIDIMNRARSRKPRTSPRVWDTGLERRFRLDTSVGEYRVRLYLPICRVSSSGISSDILLNSFLKTKGCAECHERRKMCRYTYDEFIHNGDPVRERNIGPLFLGIRRRQDNFLKLLCTRVGSSDQWLLVMWDDSRLVFGIRHGDREQCWRRELEGICAGITMEAHPSSACRQAYLISCIIVR